MAFIKRIVLFLAVNFLVVMTLSILLKVFGVRPYLTHYGIDYEQLMAFCLIWGMGGSFISLLLSKTMAKWMMGVQVIHPATRDASLQQLVQTVHQLAKAAYLPAMPEVGVYESPEVNAFATGPSRGNALVAVSSGLLRRMNQNELEGVLGHEISHISNGDMVTMTLLQGIVNAFAMFLSRAIAFAISQAMRSRDRDDRRGEVVGHSMSSFLIQMFLEAAFMILGSLIVAAFSRYREYRADAGGARLAGRDNMIRALEKLKRTFDSIDTSMGEASQSTFRSFKISGKPSSFMRLFASHPPLEDRIARLSGKGSLV